MAIQRLNNTKLIDVDPNPMMAVAICAVFFNIVLGLLLRGVPHSHGHSHGGSHGSHNHGEHVRLEDSFDDDVTFESTKNHEHINIRAAMIHVLGDLIQSIGKVLITYLPNQFLISILLC